MSRTIRAIELDHSALGRIVTVTDHRGERVTGRLDRFELLADERARVLAWVATEHPAEGGGTYWATFGSDRYLDRDSPVRVLARAAAERVS